MRTTTGITGTPGPLTNNELGWRNNTAQAAINTNALGGRVPTNLLMIAEMVWADDPRISETDVDLLADWAYEQADQVVGDLLPPGYLSTWYDGELWIMPWCGDTDSPGCPNPACACQLA